MKAKRESIVKAYRQGDVSILAATNLPKGARRVKGEPVLARGEVTGHAHRISQGRVAIYRIADLFYLRVFSERAKLCHEEHQDVLLPKGDYEIRRQREFNWVGSEVRDVSD